MSEKVLYLSLNKKWFDLIKSGEKKEEYRELGEYWGKRLVDEESMIRDFNSPNFDASVLCRDLLMKHVRHFDSVVFTCGYPKADDTERRLVFKNPKIRIGEGKPEWGAEKGKTYYVITWEEK